MVHHNLDKDKRKKNINIVIILVRDQKREKVKKINMKRIGENKMLIIDK